MAEKVVIPNYTDLPVTKSGVEEAPIFEIRIVGEMPVTKPSMEKLVTLMNFYSAQETAHLIKLLETKLETEHKEELAQMKREKRKEYLRQYSRKYYEENKEKLLERHKQKYREKREAQLLGTGPDRD